VLGFGLKPAFWDHMKVYVSIWYCSKLTGGFMGQLVLFWAFYINFYRVFSFLGVINYDSSITANLLFGVHFWTNIYTSVRWHPVGGLVLMV
jgi:hypothetical protein